MAVVDKCCCCCQLRTGVMVLGWFGLVWSLFDVAASGAAYANRDSFFENAEPALKNVVNTYMPMYIAYCVMMLVIYILLAWGASSGNRFLLLPWIIMEMISLVVATLAVFIGGIVILVNGGDGNFIGAIVLGVGLPILGIQLYIWLCVLSCFQELRDTQVTDRNALVELPGPLNTVISDYNPPEYERLHTKGY